MNTGDSSSARLNRVLMATPRAAVSPGTTESLARMESLDAFRGLVIVAMTLVNYLAGVANLPAWTQHRPEAMEGYTFVDLVFPGFLFIVGVAIPLALHHRLSRGDPPVAVLGRILLRAASLLFVGVIMVNKGFFSPEATGMGRSWWYLLAMLCVVALWKVYPADVPVTRRQVYLALRVSAGLLLAVLVLLFRGKDAAGNTVWLQPAWWGILGLIGWAYLVNCGAYLVFRGSALALSGTLGLMIALYVGGRHGALDWLGPVQDFINVGQVFGSTAADVMIGVLVGSTFVGPAAGMSSGGRLRFLWLLGVGLFVAGTLLRPLHGINKVAATEAYALVSGAWCVFGFFAVYLLMDVLNLRGWAGWLLPVGQNALLAFILPGILSSFLGVFGAQQVLSLASSGLPGALNAIVLTALVVALTSAATRVGIRLRI